LYRGELDWIVIKALEKDRQRRYETASALAADVQRYLDDEPVQACPPSAWYRLRKLVRRNKTGVLTTAAAVALMLGAGAGLWSWQHQQALRHAEREFHAELTRRSVEASLEQLKELHRRAMWKQAEALLDQADQQLGPDGDGELRKRLAQARRDTAFIQRLDDIRLERSVIVEQRLNFAVLPARYRDAFFEHEFDILEGEPADLAAKLNASEVRDYLLAALDDWAMGGTQDRQRVMVITAAATGQEWRRQLDGVWNDGVRLSQVYEAIPNNERTPGIITGVGSRLTELGQDGIRRLEEGLRHYPGDFRLHYELGLGYLRLKEDRPDAAIGAFRAALALRPGTAVVHESLGIALRQKKEYKAAIAELKEAIRLAPKFAKPHYHLGVVLGDKAEYEAAIAEFKEAIRLDPKDPRWHSGLGRVLYDKKVYDAAIAEFKEAIRLDPKKAEPHSSLGNVLLEKKECDVAMAEFKEATRLDPKDAVPHVGLGNALLDKKEYDAATPEYKKEYDAAIPEYPGFDGTVKPWGEGETVTSLEFLTDHVADISPVRALPKLTRLCCTSPNKNGKVADLSPLKGMALQSLLLYGNRVTDLSPLKGMPLELLNCGVTNVEDLSPLQGMRLVDLNCGLTRVKDLSPLKGMPLTYLYCAGTGVADLGPLKGMPLKFLGIEYTKVADLSALQGMALNDLACLGTNVKDLSPLKGMPLRALDCAGTKVTDLTPIRGMKTLRHLNIYYTDIKDLAALQDIPLQALEMQYTKVADLAPLRGMPLTTLDFGATSVKDLTPLKGMPLTSVNCAETLVTDLTPLKGMPLKTFGVDFKPERDAELLHSIKTLETINGTPAAEFWKKVDAARKP
jgi:tetratricopeptide (TPR) repeat protein/Leucine-rich repeat (LRR) protein